MVFKMYVYVAMQNTLLGLMERCFIFFIIKDMIIHKLFQHCLKLNFWLQNSS
jgi:hypothetical protein